MLAFGYLDSKHWQSFDVEGEDGLLGRHPDPVDAGDGESALEEDEVLGVLLEGDQDFLCFDGDEIGDGLAVGEEVGVLNLQH